MGTRIGELVERFGGQLIGDPGIEVSAIAPLERAGPADLGFLANGRLRALAARSRAAALVLAPADEAEVAAVFAGACIVSANPHAYFARAAQFLLPGAVPEPGIHPSASVDPDAWIDPLARIGPHVTVEQGALVAAGAVIDAGCFIGREAVVGEGTHLFANASLHARCVIGARGIVHSGAVIGADGFGFALDDGVYIKVPQVGRVLVGDDVEIGAGTSIDRGALDDTVVGDGVKLDNQIQIGHNCRIGAHTAMAGCVGVAGSAVIGSHCTFGGAAMVNGHIEIADHVHVTAGTLVAHSIRAPGRYTGFYPIAPHAEWERGAALLRNLPSLRAQIRALQRALRSLGSG